ncbi:MAG: translation initiation factor IF-2 N-terminal domain-containing protein, partial [Blastocatellia bacterium]
MPTRHDNKIRIYDLAKELKLENKKVLEDARREGIDVSVPSNTVPHDVAERIRLKYFPKKLAPQAGPRLVKHVKPVEPVEAPPETEQPEIEPEPQVAAERRPGAAPSVPEPPRPKVRVLKAAPQPQPSESSAPQPAETPDTEAQAPTAEPSRPAGGPVAPLPGMPSTQHPPTNVRVLRPRPGMPSPSPASRGTGGSPAYPGAGGPGAGLRAVSTEGGVATETGVPAARPRTTYVPQDTGRPRKRTRRGKRGPGEFGHEEGKHVDL